MTVVQEALAFEVAKMFNFDTLLWCVFDCCDALTVASFIAVLIGKIEPIFALRGSLEWTRERR